MTTMLGGTLGNFPPGTRRMIIGLIRGLLAPGDHLVVGVDIDKAPEIIERAYDDAMGVTARFNLNVLDVLNKRLDADFDTSAFEHCIILDRSLGWLEMRLRAKRPSSVTLRKIDLTVDFRAGEEIRTEITAKFTRERLEADFAANGMTIVEWNVDEDALFAVAVVGVKA
jgi:L-histidine N-alpha-methyltransferase